jgi:hypothetical protein
MTGLHLNPMYYLKHAWDATHSPWGKITIVSFYTFIWFQIIWAVQIIIAPTMGMECVYSSLNGYASTLLKMWARCCNVVSVGFFLYADRGGIKVWNVMMVFLVYGAVTYIFMSVPDVSIMKGAPKTPCDQGSWDMFSYVAVGWIFVTLVCSYMESRCASSHTSRGTPDERAPLV